MGILIYYNSSEPAYHLCAISYSTEVHESQPTGIKEDTGSHPDREPSMDLTYRFRYLLYFAAFMLIMSVCFVYAEPLPPSQLLFRGTSSHAGFLPPAAAQPSFDAAALRTAVTPAVSPNLLQQVLTESRTRHSFLHRSRPMPLRFAALPAPDLSSSMPASAGAARP